MSEGSSYSDEEFLSILPRSKVVHTHRMAGAVGCVLATANRRLIELAKEGRVEVYDPDADGGAWEIPENESTRRILWYRMSVQEAIDRDRVDELRDRLEDLPDDERFDDEREYLLTEIEALEEEMESVPESTDGCSEHDDSERDDEEVTV